MFALRPDALAHDFKSDSRGGRSHVQVSVKGAAVGDGEVQVAGGQGSGAQAAALTADEHEERPVQVSGIEGNSLRLFGGASHGETARFEVGNGFFGLGYLGSGHIFGGP